MQRIAETLSCAEIAVLETDAQVNVLSPNFSEPHDFSKEFLTIDI